MFMHKVLLIFVRKAAITYKYLGYSKWNYLLSILCSVEYHLPYMVMQNKKMKSKFDKISGATLHYRVRMEEKNE